MRLRRGSVDLRNLRHLWIYSVTAQLAGVGQPPGDIGAVAGVVDVDGLRSRVAAAGARDRLAGFALEQVDDGDGDAEDDSDE